MDAAEKGGYEHFMLKEIHEQPTAVKTTIAPRIVNGMPDLSECGLTDEMLKNYRKNICCCMWYSMPCRYGWKICY